MVPCATIVKATLLTSAESTLIYRNELNFHLLWNGEYMIFQITFHCHKSDTIGMHEKARPLR